MRKKISVVLPVFFLLLLAVPFSCYYDNEEYLYPGQQCDISDVSFSADIQPVLQQYCVSCHNISLPSGNVILESYNDILVVVNNGRFAGAINHQAGFSPMPQGQPQLPSCPLLMINTWLEQGAPQN